MGLHEKQFYFSIWLQEQCSWAAVEVFEQHFVELRYGSRKTQAWMMHGEMMQLFHSEEVVLAMQQQCKNDTTDQCPLVRPHPRIPSCLAAQQYLMIIEDKLIETADKVLKRGASMSFTPEGDAGETVVRGIMAGSKAAFGAGVPSSAAPSHHQLAFAEGAEDAEPMQKMLKVADETPEDRQKRLRLERFEKAEREKEERQQKRDEDKDARLEKQRLAKEAAKADRVAQAATPAGRARIWLAGLQEYVRKADDEIKHCSTSDCALPEGLRNEYKNQWAQRSKNFKSMRTKIEAILNGSKETSDFKVLVDKCEKELKTFKADLLRYKSLERSYVKTAERLAAEEEAEKSYED